MGLRGDLIRLARSNKQVRAAILPLLQTREAGEIALLPTSIRALDRQFMDVCKAAESMIVTDAVGEEIFERTQKIRQLASEIQKVLAKAYKDRLDEYDGE